MKRRTILRIVFGACFLTALAIGGTLWFLPPQFQPWVVYNLKFGGLYPAMRDAGEGTLIDYGPRAAIYRYVVDLGDLTAASRIDKTFLVSGLPAEKFTLGFDVSGSTGTGSLLFDTPNIGTVLVEVTTESGDPIVLEKGPLSDWIWSGPLARDDYPKFASCGPEFIFSGRPFGSTRATCGSAPSGIRKRTASRPTSWSVSWPTCYGRRCIRWPRRQDWATSPVASSTNLAKSAWST